MKFAHHLLMIFAVFVLFSSCSDSSSGKKIVSSSTSEDLPIVIIGPSTVYIEKYPDKTTPFHHYSDDSVCKLYGWGELLPEVSKNPNSIYNFAQPGASAVTFRTPPEKRDENEQIFFGPNKDHYWAKAKEKMQDLKKGILLVQFGGNDARYLKGTQEEIERAFKDSVQFYVDEAKKLNFKPVLISSIEKRVFDENGNLTKQRGDFPKWMRELAEENGVEFLDLNKKSFDEYSKSSEQELNSKFADCYNIWRYNDLVRNYHLSEDEAKVQARENTHFEKRGAKIVAGWIKELACEERESLLCQQFK